MMIMIRPVFLALAATFLTTACLASSEDPTMTVRGGVAAQKRELQATFDFFDIAKDLCDNSNDRNGPAVLGRCDTRKFPVCEEGKSQICYNRKPSREEFHEDTHQPIFYIQYDRVFCYPNNYEGCSSCTPGRYCSSEQRCILEEEGYPCAQWY